ncbi:Transcription factor tau 55 kDa subunit [Durusdinium trenchii]|uniref:Transcription factor tau 55 kDa subunit n=1 Tax=Durusdinium trenchii TaxID=1381693 RepID=A0ABP0M400_9DINO
MSLSNGEIGMARVFLLRHGERSDGPGLPSPGVADAPLSGAGVWQARLTALRLKELLGEETRIMVVTSPARRCVQTAWLVARVLEGAERYVEPGLADWTEEVNIDRGGTPCYWPTLSSGPVWDRPPAEERRETWDMAVERYQVTCEGGEAQIALTELGVSRADGLQHDCLAWRERFAFVAARGEKLFLSPQCSHVTARPFQMDPDLGDIMASSHSLRQAPLTLVKSRRARHLLLFLHDAQGHLLHLASGLLLSLKDEQLVLSSRPGIYWHLNHSGELVANDGHPLVLGPEGLGLQLDAERGASLPAVHLELVPL